MHIIEAPNEGWLLPRFRCNQCQAVVQFEREDRLHLSFSARRGMNGAWTVTRRCENCLHPLATFEEVYDRKD